MGGEICLLESLIRPEQCAQGARWHRQLDDNPAQLVGVGLAAVRTEDTNCKSVVGRLIPLTLETFEFEQRVSATCEARHISTAHADTQKAHHQILALEIQRCLWEGTADSLARRRWR